VPEDLLAGTVAGITDGTLLGGNGAQRPNLVGPLKVALQLNPGGGANNPNLITNSGLAQPLIGQFGTLGRNVLRLNPLIEFDPARSHQFAIREHLKLKLQAQVFNIFNNTTFSLPWSQPFVSIHLRILQRRRYEFRDALRSLDV
jgi:hypothetical protein